jgi:ribonucleotide monophosphatase NagD (HAD superfamily)
MQAAITASTDVQPLIVGKPETPIIQQCLRLLGAEPENTAILGDRLDTDILGGARGGIGTILVLTGISTAEEAQAFQTPPDMVVRDLPHLIDHWDRARLPCTTRTCRD